MSDESAVEVGPDQTNLSVHRSNLEIDFANATSNGFDDEVRLRAGNGTAAKRLADYNIDLRAKGRTGGDRFLVQREDCGKKIFLTDQITKAAAAGKFDDVESLEKQLTADVRRLQEDCEQKKEKLRATFGAR